MIMYRRSSCLRRSATVSNASPPMQGYLVLEPQPWRSYRSAVNKSQTCDVPFRRIEQLELRPEAFLGHLTSALGFVVVADLNSGSTAHNFDRPLYVLQRPLAAP